VVLYDHSDYYDVTRWNVYVPFEQQQLALRVVYAASHLADTPHGPARPTRPQLDTTVHHTDERILEYFPSTDGKMPDPFFLHCAALVRSSPCRVAAAPLGSA